MRSSAKIDKISTSICSCHTIIWDLVGDQLNLEWIVREKLEGLLFIQDDALEFLLLSRYLFHLILYNLKMIRCNMKVSVVGVVEKSWLNRRTKAEMGTELVLQALSKNMRTGMPEGNLSFWCVEVEDL